MVAVAVPHGGKPTTPIAGQPARATPNKTLFTYTLDSPIISGRYSMIQQVLDCAPGSSTLKHHRGGAGVTTVMRGQITLNSDGTAYNYGVGQSFTEVRGQDMQSLNRRTIDAIVAATFLLPDGASSRPTTSANEKVTGDCHCLP